MAYHDVTTGNAAFAACYGAIAVNPSDATGADYARSNLIASAFAVEFDALLNTAGTVGANASRGIFAAAIIAEVFALNNVNPNNLVAVNGSGQGSVDPTQAASWATIAAACVAKYGAGVATLQ